MLADLFRVLPCGKGISGGFARNIHPLHGEIIIQILIQSTPFSDEHDTTKSNAMQRVKRCKSMFHTLCNAMQNPANASSGIRNL